MTSLEMAGVSISVLHLDNMRRLCLGKRWDGGLDGCMCSRIASILCTCGCVVLYLVKTNPTLFTRTNLTEAFVIYVKLPVVYLGGSQWVMAPLD